MITQQIFQQAPYSQAREVHAEARGLVPARGSFSRWLLSTRHQLVTRCYFTFPPPSLVTCQVEISQISDSLSQDVPSCFLRHLLSYVRHKNISQTLDVYHGSAAIFGHVLVRKKISQSQDVIARFCRHFWLHVR
jgi:hypothetical protein